MKIRILPILAGVLSATMPCRAQEEQPTLSTLDGERITETELATKPATADLAQKIDELRFEFLCLSATVFDQKTTLLRWWHDGVEHRAYSNINFHEARAANFFEKDGVVYLVFMAIGDEDSENLATWNARAAERGLAPRPVQTLPDLSRFAEGEHGYIVDGQRGADEAYAPIDAFHQYFSQNRESLIDVCRQWEIQNKAQQEWLKANPPKYEDKPNLDLWFRPGAQKF